SSNSFSLACIHPLNPHFRLFFNDSATTAIYTLSLHDALPISRPASDDTRFSALPRPTSASCTSLPRRIAERSYASLDGSGRSTGDRKSTRLNSSHVATSYAAFCLKKKTAARLRSAKQSVWGSG